ncbi:MAG: hypothetical protein LBU62_07955 [Bacteroidales bacterium]|nr:hypothetical protein [Bacteroidales bacterium]
MYTLYKLVEVLAHRKERLNLVEKLDFSAGATPLEHIGRWLMPLSTPSNSSFSTLRIGLLLIGIGLGLGIATAIPHIAGITDWEFRGQVLCALMMVFGGLGLLIAYLIEQKKKKQ